MGDSGPITKGEPRADQALRASEAVPAAPGTRRADMAEAESAKSLQQLARCIWREQDALWNALSAADYTSEAREQLRLILPALLSAWEGRRPLEAELNLQELSAELVRGFRGPPPDSGRALLACLRCAAPHRRFAPAHELVGAALQSAIAAQQGPEGQVPSQSVVQVRSSAGSRIGLIGVSRAIRQVEQRILRVAKAPGPVLIVGQSGTGKELVAQALHRCGAGKARPFVAVNCAAFPKDLIESELFGHEKGAFTGSHGSSIGLMRAADDGVLFLDEVSEMSLPQQSKLLRSLEQRSVRAVGGLREHPFRARVVAACNRDPLEAVRSGTMRMDLFFRLSAHRIELPALADRPEDIPPLLEHFRGGLESDGHPVPRGFSEASVRRLQSHSWPGNVRELRNVVEHCCAAAPASIVEPHHLPSHIQEASSTPPAGSKADQIAPLHAVERAHIVKALRAAGGNKAHAARLLALSRHQLYLRLERLQIAE